MTFRSLGFLCAGYLATASFAVAQLSSDELVYLVKIDLPNRCRFDFYQKNRTG